MSGSTDPSFDPARLFAETLGRFEQGRPILILGHNDADGLSATAILARALAGLGRECRTRIVGRGENPWSDSIRAELARAAPGGLVVTDLGVREGDLASCPTIVIDHHVPTGTPGAATLITGYGHDPIPTSSLLAFRSVAPLVPDPNDLLWLAALGIIGDLAEDDGFPEMAAARARYGVTALRKAASLVNAPRRSASGDASPALALLMRADGPKAILSGALPETAALLAAKEEVKVELARAKTIGPKLRGGVALIAFSSPCQIHPLIAQTWRGRLKGSIVLAANFGFRPGWVHFAARAGNGTDLIAYLAEHRPPGADENYGSGHRAASGGALRLPDWKVFIAGLGFGPEEQVAA
jgi:single-stranded-DNA-specific exonuclease